jgi:glycosyltransferase involved in cell wall biosynthesis
VKVLQLCAVDFTAYHLLRPLGEGLRRAGFDVTFCCSPGEGLELLQRAGFGVAAVPISRNYNLARHFVSFIRLLRLMRRGRFDIVHAHTPVAGLIGRVAARIAGVPLVVYTAHGFYFHEGMHPSVRQFFIGLERFAGRHSDLIFVQSEEDWREAIHERVAPTSKLIHIGNGVELELFGRERHVEQVERLRRELGIGHGNVVGFVGRIVREKGAVEFARAAVRIRQSHPKTRFVMVGAPLESDRDGCWGEIERIREEGGLAGDLVLTGYRQDVPALLALFDLFVLPSHREGMPRALIEAMATGLPVVATDIRGCREEVIDGVTGILCPARDIERLAEAVCTLLDSPDTASAMGAAGRERARELFDERVIVERQVAHLEQLCRAEISPPGSAAEK